MAAFARFSIAPADVSPLSSLRNVQWMSDVVDIDESGGRHYSIMAYNGLSAVMPPPLAPVPCGLGTSFKEIDMNVGMQQLRVQTAPACSAVPMSSASVRAYSGATGAPSFIVRVGDTVCAWSTAPEAASMSVALVEDMWEALPGSFQTVTAAVDTRRVRLRWFLTIQNIAISRARLPRGSQVRGC
jgi:hypothetical protein